MKKILLLASLALVVGTAKAQHTVTEQWPAGNKLSEGQYNANPGILPTDSKTVIAQKLSGVYKVGSWTYWHENGQISAQEQYSSTGDFTGTWKTFYASGKASTTIDMSSGAATYWFENGTKSSEGKLKNGVTMIGKWVGWYENGNKNFEGNYNNDGLQDGVWTYWTNDGRKMTEQTWKNGTLVDTKNFTE